VVHKQHNNTVFESSNATSGAHCIHLCYTVLTICVYLRCRDFMPKCFSIEKLRLQEAQY
jgi:hypothetical protein